MRPKGKQTSILDVQESDVKILDFVKNIPTYEKTIARFGKANVDQLIKDSKINLRRTAGKTELFPIPKAKVKNVKKVGKIDVSLAEPLDDVVKTGFRHPGKLTEEQRQLQERFKVFRLNKNLSTIDEVASSLGKTENELMQELLVFEKKGVKIAKLKAEEEFFLANARANAEDLVKKRGAATKSLHLDEDVQFGVGLPFKFPKIKVSDPSTFTPKVTFGDAAKEAAWHAAKGVPTQSLASKFKEKLGQLARGFATPFVHLPVRDTRFGPAREILRQLKSSRAATARDALDVVKQMVKDVEVADIDLAMRKLKMEDYLQGLTAEQRKAAPFGFNEVEIAAELKKIDQALEASPLAKRLVRETRGILDQLGDKLVKAGILTEEQLTKNYFHRQILQYAGDEALFRGAGKKLKRPRPGFARARKGSELPDNTDYLQSFYSFLADAKHDLRLAESLQKFRKEYDILGVLREEHGTIARAMQNIPEGNVPWQPEVGNVIYKTTGLTDKIANELMADQAMAMLDGLEASGMTVTAKDLREILAIGKQKETWIIPEELAAQLNDLKGEALIGGGGNKILRAIGLKQATTLWKKWTLTSPKRVVQYNFRNFIGDSDAVHASDPAIFKKVPQATKELKEWMFEGKPMSKELKEFSKRGGLGSTFVEVEARELNKVEEFERFFSSIGADIINRKNLGTVPRRSIRKAWGKLIDLTQFREDILRHAAYLHYRNQALSGGLKKFGISAKEEVLSLSNPLDQAAKVSRELLGDYANISKFGQAMRDSVVPFYSWLEINMKRWPLLIKNAYQESLLTGAKVSAARGGMLAAGFLRRISTAYAATWVWNNKIAPQVFGVNIEDKLSEFDRNRLHVSLGLNDDGTVRFVRTPTAFGDFLEFFGLNEMPVLFDSFNRQIIDSSTLIRELMKAPGNKLVQSVTPLFKVPVEVLTGRKFFPDAFNPGVVTDKWEHFFRVWQVDDIYRSVKNIPSRRGLGENFLKSIMLITEYDHDEIAYYDTLALKRDFLKSKGRESGFGFSERTQSYRNYKKALKFGKKKVADALLEDMANKGWLQGLSQSLRASNPTFGLNKADKKEFKTKFMNGLQRVKFNRAMKFYESVLEDSKIPNELRLLSAEKSAEKKLHELRHRNERE